MRQGECGLFFVLFFSPVRSFLSLVGRRAPYDASPGGAWGVWQVGGKAVGTFRPISSLAERDFSLPLYPCYTRPVHCNCAIRKSSFLSFLKFLRFFRVLSFLLETM